MDLQPNHPSAVIQKLIHTVRAQGEKRMGITFEGSHQDSQADGFVIRRSMPNRRVLLQRYHQPGCPFCRRPATEFLIEEPYLGQILSQNLAPYDKISLLLRSQEHYTQADTTDLVEKIGGQILSQLPDNITIICNQMAGNSQEHFHLQYIGGLLPVTGLAPILAPLWQPTNFGDAQHTSFDGQNRVHNPDQLPIEHFQGYFVKGTAAQTTQCAIEYLRKAEAAGYHRYNFVIWRDHSLSNNFEEQLCWFIVLRNEATLMTGHPEYPMVIGALSVAGLIMFGRPLSDLSPFDYDDFVKYLRSKISAPLSINGDRG